MDEFHDTLLPNPSWADVNSIQGSSWVCTTASQTASALPETHGKLEQNRVVPTDRMLGGAQHHEFDENADIFVADDLKYGLDHCYFPIDNLTQQNIPSHVPIESQYEEQTTEKPCSLRGATESKQAAGSFCVDHGSVGSNDTEPSVFLKSLEDSPCTSGVPLPPWSSGYPNVPSLAMDHVNLPNFGGVHGEFVGDDVGILGRRCNEVRMQKGTPPTLLDGQTDPHKPMISPFSPISQMNLTANTGMLSTNSQLSQSCIGDSIQLCTNNSLITQAHPITPNVNGTTPKPRRARRGQATDPHSIAERLRREKISERMKSLQELVPNSSKTDKASMLDEIIDYVKFLQLQVKVLSMSRVGAAGAVVPLITDIQPEEKGNPLLPPTVDLGGNDTSESDDNLEFEREVVKLMESNITTAMQYLQTKGLCLMPTALAAAISSRKGSSTAIPPEKKKPDDASTRATSFNKSESNDRPGPPRGFNGTVIKQEDYSQRFPSNVTDLDPKAWRGSS